MRRRGQNKAGCKFVLRHIFRSPLKNILIAAAALFFTAALGVLNETISHTASEIDRLYDTTVVTGEVRPSDPMAARQVVEHIAPMANTILRQTVEALLETGFLQSYYAEVGFPWFYVIPAGEDGNFPTGVYGNFWQEFFHHITERYGRIEFRLDPLFAVSCTDKFLAEFSSPDVAPGAIGDGNLLGDIHIIPPLEIQFYGDYGWADFYYYDANLQAPVPIILAVKTLELRGLEPGDRAFIGTSTQRPTPSHFEIPVTIIGSHNGGIGRPMAEHGVLLPFTVLEFIRGRDLGYITFRFEIDTARNREISAVHAELQSIVRNPEQDGFVMKDVILFDEELRVVVGQMEQNLSLLRLLYPAAIAFSTAIGAVLGTLLLLQNAKNAAIMRVLGYTKIRARIMLCAEHLLVALTGAAIALIATPLLGAGNLAAMVLLAGLYLLGAAIGSIAGAVIITSRAPLDLLQVRE